MIFQTTFRLALRTHTTVTTIFKGNRHRLRAHVHVNTRDIPRRVQPQQQTVVCFQTVHAQIPFLNDVLIFFETQSNQQPANKFIEEPDSAGEVRSCKTEDLRGRETQGGGSH